MIPSYVLLAIIYDLFLYKLTHVVYSDLSIVEKTQRSYQLLLLVSVAGLVIPKLLLTIPNDTLRDGIILGSYILLCMTVVIYWNDMTDEWKLFLLGLIFFYMIWLKDKD